MLLDNVRPTTSRLAAIFRTIAPDAPLEQFTAFVKDNLAGGVDPAEPKLAKLYAQYAPEKMSLADRGYLAGVHPLELWLVGYLRNHPGRARRK